MQPLATTRLTMIWLSMCSGAKLKTPREKNGYTMHTLGILIVNSIGVLASLAYCLQFYSVDFDGATFGFMTAMILFGSVYVLIAAILMRQEIDNVFIRLSTIYDDSKLN